MTTRWGNLLVGSVISRAAREVVVRLSQPSFLLGPDWRVVLANSSACEAFALDPDETVGERIFDLADGGWDVPALRGLIERDLTERDLIQHRPLELVLPVAGHRVFQVTAVRLRGRSFDTGLTLLSFQDETERTRAETRLRGLLEGAPDAMIVVDQDGAVRLVNRQAVALFGYTREELLSQHVDVLVPDAVRSRHPGHRASYLAEPRIRPMGADLELAARRKDGSEFPVDIALSPIETDDGLLVVAAVRDITERRQADRDRAELESQLRDAQRMESMGRLAGGIAHDFSNVLSVIQGYASLTLSELPPDAPARAELEQIDAAAGHGAALTTQLLALSRRQVLQPVLLDLNAIVEEVAPMLRRLLGDDIELTTVLEAHDALVRADPGQLELLIMNLALNGRDSMPGGGRLMIETANVELDDDYARHHAGVTPGDYVQLAVTDSGLGMDAHVLGRVFEPFFTTKEPGRGTGLGLATVYGVAQQSGGSVWAYSEPGEGSTFKVYLPRVEGVPEPRAPLEAAVALVGGTESILVVEDDDRVRSVLRDILERYGYRVVLARTGDEALKAAAQEPRFDLVVTDLMLPGMNGRELADRLVETNPALRVLFLSGYAENAVVHQGILDPGVNFLAKPFSTASLIRRVRGVLDDRGDG